LHNIWMIIIFSWISRKMPVKGVHNAVISPTFHKHSCLCRCPDYAIRDIPDKKGSTILRDWFVHTCFYYTHARVHYRSNSEISDETVNIIIIRRVSDICMYVCLWAGFLLSIRWFKYHLSNMQHRCILVTVSRSL